MRLVCGGIAGLPCSTLRSLRSSPHQSIKTATRVRVGSEWPRSSQAAHACSVGRASTSNRFPAASTFDLTETDERHCVASAEVVAMDGELKHATHGVRHVSLADADATEIPLHLDALDGSECVQWCSQFDTWVFDCDGVLWTGRNTSCWAVAIIMHAMNWKTG